MNLRLKAFLQTTAVFGSAIVMAYVIDYITHNVETQTLQSVFAWSCITGLMYMVYKIMLSRLEYFETVKNLTSEYNKK
jgi:hypothetical protein